MNPVLDIIKNSSAGSDFLSVDSPSMKDVEEVGLDLLFIPLGSCHSKSNEDKQRRPKS